MDISKIVGANLKTARQLKGYTQENVAKQLCMTQQQYSRFENGIFELSYDQILKLCAILEITPDELFGFESKLS